MKIIIPSSREKVKTLRFFPDAIVFANQLNNIPEARNVCLTMMEGEEIVLMLDDDISCVKKQFGEDLINVDQNNMEEMHDYHVQLMKKYNSPMCGVGTPMQAWRNDGKLVKIFGRVFSAYYLNVKLMKQYGLRFDERMTMFEDWDMAMQIVDKGLTQLVSFKYVMDSGHWLAKGGCSNYRTATLMEEKTRYFMLKWHKYAPHIQPIMNPVSKMFEPRIQ
jgi:glycosyltransferase involved in cell wall biosynthesis